MKQTGLLTGGAAFMQAWPDLLQRVLNIDPAPGSTFYDAEHVVFLMQENRSFDHAFGTLQGVRGFNDPRAIHLPNQHKVWLQTNKAGETYAPFHLDIHNTKITWMGSLPHGWDNQVDARNGGLYNQWLDAKDPGGDFKGLPLTMGYYNRGDIPFYYALADAFTVCDHNFCSSLTGTTPNRLYFWSGTIRAEKNAAAQANVWNQNADYGAWIHWKTYPERLEENGISWKVYQNEIYGDVGLGEAQPWLDNFGDNPLEYFTQYQVRLSPEYIARIPGRVAEAKEKISALQEKIKSGAGTEKEIKKWNEDLTYQQKQLETAEWEQVHCTMEKFNALPEVERSIHQKAFSNNRNDEDYHRIHRMHYTEGNAPREIDIPKGDVLYQFRQDVKHGKLPMVSWLVAPERFSDHPSAPWFGAWYFSEVISILSENPELWKKTIFVLTYDENDGYFDHLPPFAAPDPDRTDSGKVSAGIDTSLEFVRMDQQSEKDYARESTIGLGYRVPMIIASPWSRGGYVCSEVFDHTSSLQFLEKFIEKKTGKKIIEENITSWRRTVCGDLTAAFRTYQGEKINKPPFVKKDKFIRDINNAQYRKVPDNYKKLSAAEISLVNQGRGGILPKQEPGIRPACALPYELYADGGLNSGRTAVDIRFTAGADLFGEQSAGSPFYVYARLGRETNPVVVRNYAVRAGDTVRDEWLLSAFNNNQYDLQVHGPNGFYRHFTGNGQDPLLGIRCNYQKEKGSGRASGHLELGLANNDAQPKKIRVSHNGSYGNETLLYRVMQPGESLSLMINTKNSFGWYDFVIRADGHPAFLQQYAGHVETGRDSKTDPLMGGVAPQ